MLPGLDVISFYNEYSLIKINSVQSYLIKRLYMKQFLLLLMFGTVLLAIPRFGRIAVNQGCLYMYIMVENIPDMSRDIWIKTRKHGLYFPDILFLLRLFDFFVRG